MARQYKPRTAARNQVVSWWKDEDAANRARNVYDTVTYLHKQQADRADRNLRCARMYGNMDYVGLGPFAYTRPSTTGLPENRVKINIISSMVDTVSSKISKMKPRVTFLTERGNFSTQERAKKLSKFVLGAFTEAEIYTKHQALFRDGLIFDLGALKHFIKDNRICSERVLASELYTEEADALYGCPSHIYQIKFVAKSILAAQYPDQAAAIMESSASLEPDSTTANLEEARDFVVVIEAWHLKSGEDAKDGRHVICTEKAVLLDEEYTRDYFPFTFSRWSNPIVGFYGQSLAERLYGNQIEINKMLRIIQKSFHLGSAFKVFLEYGSKVAKEHINNEIGSIVYYSGAKPEFYVPKTVHEEYFRHLEWLIRSSYEEAGISQLSASSKLPAGLDGGSGKALREYNDLETDRFAIVAQEYESTFLDTARQYIDLACQLHEDGENLEVVGESKKFIESIKWSEVKLKDNQYIMQMFPTSMLPHTPAGRLAYVQELIQAQFIDKTFGLSLLEFPDIEGYTSLETAPLDDIMDTLDSLLYRGEYVAPEPFQDLQLGISIFQNAYLRAKKDDAPEARLDLVRRWIASAQQMLASASQAQAAAQGVAMANPNAAAGPATPVAAQPPMPDQGAAPLPAA